MTVVWFENRYSVGYLIFLNADTLIYEAFVRKQMRK